MLALASVIVYVANAAFSSQNVPSSTLYQQERRFGFVVNPVSGSGRSLRAINQLEPKIQEWCKNYKVRIHDFSEGGVHPHPIVLRLYARNQGMTAYDVLYSSLKKVDMSTARNAMHINMLGA